MAHLPPCHGGGLLFGSNSTRKSGATRSTRSTSKTQGRQTPIRGTDRRWSATTFRRPRAGGGTTGRYRNKRGDRCFPSGSSGRKWRLERFQQHGPFERWLRRSQANEDHLCFLYRRGSFREECSVPRLENLVDDCCRGVGQLSRDPRNGPSDRLQYCNQSRNERMSV